MSVTVAYPGPPGSHSGAAAAVLVPDASRSIGLPSFTAVIAAAASAEVGLGVLPIESSLVGPIAETHDLLYQAPLSIVREATLPIRHCLLGLPGSKVEDVTVVWSHPAAFDQCRDLLADWHVKCVPAATTADAAHHVSVTGDPTHVAIASPQAADEYELAVIADDVGDKPGALYRALGPLSRNNVNLVQLVSRPLPNSPWRYRFDVVLDGHVFDGNVRPALVELRGLTRELRLFGSYAAERAR